MRTSTVPLGKHQKRFRSCTLPSLLLNTSIAFVYLVDSRKIDMYSEEFIMRTTLLDAFHTDARWCSVLRSI